MVYITLPIKGEAPKIAKSSNWSIEERKILTFLAFNLFQLSSFPTLRVGKMVIIELLFTTSFLKILFWINDSWYLSSCS